MMTQVVFCVLVGVEGGEAEIDSAVALSGGFLCSGWGGGIGGEAEIDSAVALSPNPPILLNGAGGGGGVTVTSSGGRTDGRGR